MAKQHLVRKAAISPAKIWAIHLPKYVRKHRCVTQQTALLCSEKPPYGILGA